MLEKQLDLLIKQVEAKIKKSDMDKQYFQGALDAFLLIKEQLTEVKNVEHNQPVGPQKEESPE
jgi:hypothetical protein